MKNHFRLVIFDLDGTLADSSADVIDCFKYAFEKENIPVPPEEELKRTIGYPLKKVLAGYGDAEILHGHFIRKAREVMGSKTILLPGAMETLKELKRLEVKVCIATTKIRQNTERILQNLRIREYIDELSCADDVENVKPAPDAINRLLTLYNTARDQAVMVGDTINDIIAARNAGVASMALTTGFDAAEKLRTENPDWMSNDIRDVPRIVADGAGC